MCVITGTLQEVTPSMSAMPIRQCRNLDLWPVRFYIDGGPSHAQKHRELLGSGDVDGIQNREQVNVRSPV